MKFLLKIFILLAIVAIISAVQVERKQQKKHHARTKNPVIAVLCDAGSSKTDCGCWHYTAATKKLEKKGDGVEKGGVDNPASKGDGGVLKNVFRLGDVFAAPGDDQQAYATEYAKNVKAMVDSLSCAGYTAVYVLSTAGSRQQLSEKKLEDPGRKTLETQIQTALNAQTVFSGKAKLQVYAGRMEGYFGYAYASSIESDYTGGSAGNFVYYECGGSSCQLVFPAKTDECDTKYYAKQGWSRFRSHKKMTAKKANALKMLSRSQGIMKMKPICGLVANNDPYFKVFSNSWLGTGANLDALQSFKDCGAAQCDLTMLQQCEMKEAPNDKLFGDCHKALTNLFKSANTKDKTGEQALGPQMEGAKEQLACNAEKNDVNPGKILIQSGALSFSVKQETTLEALSTLASTECVKAKGAGKFAHVLCLTLTSYVAFFEALGIAPAARIKVTKKSNPAAGYFAWLNEGGAVDDTTRWPNPETNKKEDAAFTQNLGRL